MEDQGFCMSCGMPLNAPDAKGEAEKYCKHCTDEGGSVKSRDEVQRGIAMWLKMWQPGIDEETAMKRAEHYMKSMPEWAD